ncbi:type IV toxin-antitoxin system AbiEi family antitoxin domain-containing protein [bacterium]|nr:type IV toxin-antitoxin system AbiEi family antitoxin domain-containing protein [bacterium]
MWQGGWPEGVQLTKSIWMETVPPMLLSSPEQVFLELLMSVPEAISFEHADQIM